MSISANGASILFLQGGPGLSSRFERERLSELTTVDWWDPPLTMAAGPSALTQLYEAAEAKFDAVRARHDGPVHLLSSSFGSHMALHLVRRSARSVASLTMLAPSLDVAACYLRLAALLAKRDALPGLHDAADGYRARPDLPHFWSLAGAIMAVPDFAACYWSAAATGLAEQFSALLADASVFHFPTFQAVLNDFLAHPPLPAVLDFDGPVTVIFGDADPLIDANGCGQLVHQYLPAARLCSVAAGHFPHLECAPALWLPDAGVQP